MCYLSQVSPRSTLLISMHSDCQARTPVIRISHKVKLKEYVSVYHCIPTAIRDMQRTALLI